jgi:predicted nuclease with TOPRIM domain
LNILASSKFNAQKIYSKDRGDGTVYYLSIAPGKKHGTMDNDLLKLEQELQPTYTEKHQPPPNIFRRFSNGFPGIVKSRVPDDDAEYAFLFDTKQASGRGHKPNSGVSLHLATTGTKTPSTTTSTPTYTPEATPSPVQRAAMMIRTQEIMQPEPDAMQVEGAATNASPSPTPVQQARAATTNASPSRTPTPVPDQQTEATMRSMLQNMSHLNFAPNELAVVQAENTFLTKRCSELEAKVGSYEILIKTITPGAKKDDMIQKFQQTVMELQTKIADLENDKEDLTNEKGQLEVDMERFKEECKRIYGSHTHTHTDRRTKKTTVTKLSGPDYIAKLEQEREIAQLKLDDLFKSREWIDKHYKRWKTQMLAVTQFQEMNFKHHAKAVDDMRRIVATSKDISKELRDQLLLVLNGVPAGYDQMLMDKLDALLKEPEPHQVVHKDFIGPTMPFWLEEYRTRMRLRPFQTTEMLTIFLAMHDHGYMSKFCKCGPSPTQA